jgi:outer membrane receptor protein involved in Fe transport
VVYSDSSWSELRSLQRGIIGQLPSYTMVDFAFGADKDGRSVELFIKNAFDERAELTRYAECTTEVCGGDPNTGAAHDRYAVPQRPRTFGIRFGQKF